MKFLFLLLIILLFFISCDKSFDASNPFGMKNDYGYEEGRCVVTPDCGNDELGCNIDTNKCELHKGKCNACKGSEKCEGHGAEGSAVFKCAGGSTSNTCDGVDCGGKGACVYSGNTPSCNCNEGYQDNNNDLICTVKCKENECGTNAKCNDVDRAYKFCGCIDGVTCGEHGSCSDDEVAGAICECEEGYKALDNYICASKYWDMVSVGFQHTCGIRGGELYCWGDDQLSTTDSTSPLKIGHSDTWSNISSGKEFTCGVKAGELYCWGSSGGNLGFGYGDNTTLPTIVGVDKNWEQVSIGGDRSLCGIKEGELYCWGDNENGRLGLGDAWLSNEGCFDDVSGKYCNIPIKVGNDKNWSTIYLGDRNSYGIRAGELYSWGWNISGMLGIGSSQTEENEPQRIGFRRNWSIISASKDAELGHSCGITQEKELYCWGDNSQNQLGVASQSSNIPIKIGDDWDSVSAGVTYTCGIKNGELYCWGSKYLGKLGLGGSSSGRASIPTKVGNKNNWLEISVGEHTTCGITLEKELYCWGDNRFGQLGLGDDWLDNEGCFNDGELLKYCNIPIKVE